MVVVVVAVVVVVVVVLLLLLLLLVLILLLLLLLLLLVAAVPVVAVAAAGIRKAFVRSSSSFKCNNNNQADARSLACLRFVPPWRRLQSSGQNMLNKCTNACTSKFLFQAGQRLLHGSNLSFGFDTRKISNSSIK